MSNKETRQRHLEIYKQRLEALDKGEVPEKHKDSPTAYRSHLVSEIKLMERILEKLSK